MLGRDDNEGMAVFLVAIELSVEEQHGAVLFFTKKLARTYCGGGGCYVTVFFGITGRRLVRIWRCGTVYLFVSVFVLHECDL